MERNFKKILIAVLALLILGAGLGYATDGFKKMPAFLKSGNSQKVAADTMSFINEQLLQGAAQAELKEVTEENGLYKLTLSVQGQEMTSYATKDGSLLFPQAIKMKKSTSSDATSSDQKESAQKEIPKSDKPEVELFVMSFCPYGNQAEDTMQPVYKLLGDKVDWNIHYIVSERDGNISSLHGQSEVDQDARELCVLENDGTKKWFQFANYVDKNCGSDGKCWQEAAAEADLNSNKITSCAEENGTQMLKKEGQISQDKGASGSPTLFINGVKSDVVYDYGNPEAYKSTICSAFNNPPEECNEELASKNTSTSGGGSCN